MFQLRVFGSKNNLPSAAWDNSEINHPEKKEAEEMDFLDIFDQLDDPRIERKKLHPLPEILLLTLCAIICGAESWGDIEMFGRSKLAFLRQYPPYEHGVPSDDTLRRFFRALDIAKAI
ncbi:MAG: transposase family protein [Methylovulum sp.]|nr:transposase family protein [Methylovulum sp.]